eukprot:CAMPEP_0116907080 /NCGR_PEP_ID=MMETSP0467-20121206/12895_1 /TAXON_ID=283647 /ORGANISM="Mesodinium pulex, Strain SPMC105" /LENGTH=112 /DNA_ID=CAMNT_0004582035 /DNA_START=345 /DNA_END=683 /DNA_ORIENTATION=+
MAGDSATSGALTQLTTTQPQPLFQPPAQLVQLAPMAGDLATSGALTQPMAPHQAPLHHRILAQAPQAQMAGALETYGAQPPPITTPPMAPTVLLFLRTLGSPHLIRPKHNDN